MKKILFIIIIYLFINGYSYANSIDIIPITPTRITVYHNEIKLIEYMITNRSRSMKILNLRELIGIRQNHGSGYCAGGVQLQSHASCILSLSIDGNHLVRDINEGPTLCHPSMGLDTLCYYPDLANTIHIDYRRADIRASSN